MSVALVTIFWRSSASSSLPAWACISLRSAGKTLPTASPRRPRALGLRDAEAYVQWLLSSPLTRREIETLASHLTVGETYFFREKRSFDILEEQVLPELIRLHRGDGMRLRIWSAGCCTGEEPYSVAMLLDRMIPDLADWNVTILATDINPRFLEIASAGVYGEWSFRAIPPGIRERYFSPLPGGRMQIAQRIRRMVTFSFLNLAEDVYPSLVNNTNAMDVVLCRNVLMYFTPEQPPGWWKTSMARSWRTDGCWSRRVKLRRLLFRQFTMVDFPDAIFYRKPAGSSPRLPSVESAPVGYPEPRVLQEKLPSGEESRRKKETVPPNVRRRIPRSLWRGPWRTRGSSRKRSPGAIGRSFPTR